MLTPKGLTRQVSGSPYPLLRYKDFSILPLMLIAAARHQLASMSSPPRQPMNPAGVTIRTGQRSPSASYAFRMPMICSSEILASSFVRPMRGRTLAPRGGSFRDYVNSARVAT